MTWLVARYHPVSLFSLRPYNATTSGGKTLIAPTAFAIKMAILSASIQTAGLEAGKARFPAIRDLRIALDLPESIVMIKSFAKIQRQAEFKGKKEERPAWEAKQIENMNYPFQPTIAYRELVQFSGQIGIACTTPSGDIPSWLGETLPALNYLGKRGSFIQIASLPQEMEPLDAGRFVEITAESGAIPFEGTLQPLDDCGATMTFAHADIYDPKRISLGNQRVIRHIVLPYRLAQSSRGFSRYERLPEDR
jgi:hypothetical protein